MHELLDDAHGLLADVAQLRHAIHREPELGLNLPLTQARVLDALQGLPLEIRRGTGITSVVADLRGGQPGPTIILRGDMDALPLHEDTDVPFKSSIDGRMHACGHDAHTAMLVGAARLLTRRQQTLHGTVRFMFQPGEESYAGAVVMLDEGLLDAPSGGMALQTLVTRSVNVFSPAVLTIGKIEAGTASNIIPEIATLQGTIRTLSPTTRATLVEGLRRVAHGVCAAHGLEADVTNHAGYPVTVNDADFARFVLETGRDLLGAEHSIEQPTPQLAAEDFAYVLEQIPGAMASLGTRPFGYAEGEAPNSHSNRYLLNEEALVTGMAMYAAVALAYLKG